MGNTRIQRHSFRFWSNNVHQQQIILIIQVVKKGTLRFLFLCTGCTVCRLCRSTQTTMLQDIRSWFLYPKGRLRASWQIPSTCIYGPTPFARHLIIDVRGNHCSHISGLFLEGFDFLAPMVICAHPPHHPSGFLQSQCRCQVLNEPVWPLSPSDHLSFATKVKGLSFVQ